MKQMMEQFEKLGEKEDFDLIVEQMMKQLLGKDVMCRFSSREVKLRGEEGRRRRRGGREEKRGAE